MGLLTSDGKSNKLVKLLTDHYGKMSFICYLCAIISMIYLIYEPDKTYFSDNALLPGLVDREFTLSDLASKTLKSLDVEAKHHIDKIPYEWLSNQFRQFGLEVYAHNFTLNYPFGSKPRFKGKNFYAILRSARSPSTESLVLSTPYRNNESPHGTTLPGIALMIAVAKYFSSKNYWAKDIIFVISDFELVGMQAWVSAYHESNKSPSHESNKSPSHELNKSPSHVLDYGVLESRSGPIQAAVNLEIHAQHTSRLDIKIEGLNGQLPNLDLFNLAVELCTRESITPTFHARAHPIDQDRFELWKQNAMTIASMMISQGITLPTGAHGLFQRFSIQAITLEAPEIPDILSNNNYIPVTFKHLGRLIEGIFRSLNNLLEKFNRSYYFYLLTSTRRYISIGYYMIPFGLLTLPLIFNALNLYLTQQNNHDNAHFLPQSLWNSLPFCFICHLHGLLLLLLPYLAERFSYLISNYSTQDVIYYTLVILSVLYLVNPFIKVHSQSFTSKRCTALLNLALLLGSLSLINISLAFGLSFVYVPIACLCKRSSVKIYKLINSCFLILLHPLVIDFLCLFAMSYYYDSKASLLSHIIRSFQGQKKVVLFYIEDWYIYGNWTYFFACAFLLPSWLQLWYIL